MSDAVPPTSQPAGLLPGPQESAGKDVTAMLRVAGEGDAAGRDELYVAVYAELRAIAARKMAAERPGHTLQPTALVHEAWLRFGGRTFTDRAHFFAAAAEAMRHILVDSARRRNRLKRGGEFERVELDDVALAAPENSDELLLVHEVLDCFAAEDPLRAEIVKLRYFVELSYQEIADALEVNEKTVRRHWELARLRLHQLINQKTGDPAEK